MPDTIARQSMPADHDRVWLEHVATAVRRANPSPGPTQQALGASPAALFNGKIGGRA